jgi:hypothetical protein
LQPVLDDHPRDLVVFEFRQRPLLAVGPRLHLVVEHQVAVGAVEHLPPFEELRHLLDDVLIVALRFALHLAAVCCLVVFVRHWLWLRR